MGLGSTVAWVRLYQLTYLVSHGTPLVGVGRFGWSLLVFWLGAWNLWLCVCVCVFDILVGHLAFENLTSF